MAKKLIIPKEILDSNVIFSPVTYENGFDIKPVYNISHEKMQDYLNKGWHYVEKSYRQILIELAEEFEEK